MNRMLQTVAKREPHPLSSALKTDIPQTVILPDTEIKLIPSFVICRKCCLSTCSLS